MGVFDEEIKIISRIEEEWKHAFRRVVEANGHELIDYNTKEQLDNKGQDSKGEELKPKYTLGYARIKIKRGRQADHVDTHLSGDFHASFFIEAGEESFSINSNVEYDKHIIKRYGKDVIGVQQQYLNEFTERHLIPELKKIAHDIITKS